MMKKRGAIEVQFNWIFVLVVGALLLTLIVGFVSSQMRSSGNQLAASIVRDTDTVLTHAATSYGKTSTMMLLRPLQFECLPECTAAGCLSSIRVQGTDVELQTPVQVLFASGVVSGDQMIIWSRALNLPYHVDNMLYLASKNTRYVFVGAAGDSVLNALKATLPPNFNTARADDGNAIQNRNNPNVRLVYHNTIPGAVPASLASMPDQGVTAINIIPVGRYDQVGRVQFYKKSGNSFQLDDELYYYGLPTLYGAMFSDTSSAYECNTQKSLIKLSVISALHAERLDLLLSNPDVETVCKNIYASMKDEVEDIGTLAQAIDLHNAAQMQDLQDYSEKIKTANNGLKLNSCPLLY
jgi:hypothetical protein